MELVALKKVDDDGLALHVGFLSNISVCCGAGAASAPLLPSPLRLGVSCRATCLKPYAFLAGGGLCLLSPFFPFVPHLSQQRWKG